MSSCERKANKQNHKESVLHIKITLLKVVHVVLRSSSPLTSSDLCGTQQQCFTALDTIVFLINHVLLSITFVMLPRKNFAKECVSRLSAD